MDVRVGFRGQWGHGEMVDFFCCCEGGENRAGGLKLLEKVFLIVTNNLP